MSDLVKTCGEINAKSINTGCSDSNKPGYPKWLLYGAQGSTITAVGEIPTPAEVQTFLDANDGVIIPVTNGAWIAPEVQTESGADTFDGLEEVNREDNGLTGNFKLVTNATLEMFAQNNLNNQRAQLWVIDDKNQFHGGVNGFSIPFYIGNYQHTGYGSKAFIALSHKWERDIDAYVEFSAPDNSYATLVNNPVEGTYAETVVTSYVAGQVQGYAGITGWVKATYPTLYFKIVSNVISIYTSSADRTAGTGAVATIDSGTSLAVVEAGSSGFGGAITFVSNAITDASEWNVTYSE